MISLSGRLLVVACLVAIGAQGRTLRAQPPAKAKPAKGPLKPKAAEGCLAVDRFFEDEVWAKVGERTCLKCHREGGDASDSNFLLHNVSGSPASQKMAMRRNCEAFQKMAAVSSEEQQKPRLLSKAIGRLDHGGGAVVKEDSTDYRILQRWLRRTHEMSDAATSELRDDRPPLFDGVEMMSPRRLLRRLTLSLAGRLPSEAEQSAVARGGLQAIDAVLDSVMQEEAFYDRLRESFNDILLTSGYDDGAESALSYTHFHKSRLWYKQRDPNRNRDSDDRLKYSHPEMREYYQLVKDYRQALRREPLELIAHIVRNDRPFTEIVTADYIMVSPYTARGYGVFEQLREKFDDPEDPFEYIPYRLQALTDDSSGKIVQESETGFYPHAGVLSTFQYLKRYPTTETNRNRLRVRMYFEHFLGVDILELAPRVGDAAAVTAQYDVPTMQAAECVVCHKVIDPIAGLFQDYYVVDGKGIFGPRRDGWYQDMFPTGLENAPLPPEEKWRALPWLGERTVKDPRFTTAMVGHAWYILTGRKPLSPPADIDDPMFAARRRAYREQREEIQRIADKFAKSDFNLKVAFKKCAQSPFYRADGVATAIDDPERLAELEDIGVARLLTPEQLERKLQAVFGEKWGRLQDTENKLGILYGGIDSKEITERIKEPSGAMGAIQRIMANENACRHVAKDFTLPPEQRRLFPDVQPDVLPGESAESDQQIRSAIVHLHALLLGRVDTADDPEVERTYRLFAGIVEEASSREGIAPVESYFCQTQRDVTPRDPDPHYTIRAWRGVVTYLLRQHEFLYE